MLKNYVKKIVVFTALVCMICMISKVSYATGSSDSIAQMLENQKNGTLTSEDSNAKPEQIAEGQTSNDNKISSENKTSTLATSTETKTTTQPAPTTTPYTGAGDYTAYVFIVIFAVSAIFGYKKFKEYNA